ncbi:MAG TPA: CRISPR-associated endonuclease Cas3'', partial [Bacteroidales bacterium]|nr:CRISPR-associated endonuclease Cas3'' [Bacteroidales bacterium]
MMFYSHSKTTKEGKTNGTKEISAHTQGVIKKAISSLSDEPDFDISASDFKKLIETIIKFHDFGKYTTYFQNYLLKNEHVDYLLKQHARIGGIVAYNFLKQTDSKLALIGLYVIFHHHTYLKDIQQFPENFNENLSRIIHVQAEDILNNIKLIEKELEFKPLSGYLS